MLQYAGVAYQAAGTCQVAHDQSEETLKALIEQMNQDGS